MVDALNFLQQNGNGILILFLVFFGIGGLTHYTMWLLGKGRFKGDSEIPKDKNFSFVIATAAIKLIDDFRHLLALILILVFSLVLGYAVYLGRGSMDSLKDALQAVMATLGGLVGSIIGYYFGEARASLNSGSTSQPPPAGPSGSTPPIQAAPSSPIVEAPRPPSETPPLSD